MASLWALRTGRGRCGRAPHGADEHV